MKRITRPADSVSSHVILAVAVVTVALAPRAARLAQAAPSVAANRPPRYVFASEEAA